MKNKVLIMAMAAISMASCSDSIESQDTPIAETDMPNISTVIISNEKIVSELSTRSTDEKGEKALRFKDYASYISFKSSLENESNSECENIVRKYGVTSLHELAHVADEELEKIGNEAISEQEFHKLYEKYKSKYAGYLITNPYDPTDLTLYVPDEDNIETYIANTKGVYVIGNQVVRAKTTNNVSESVFRMSKALAMPNSDIPTNSSVYKPEKKKRVYLDAYMINIRMWVKMHCQKKMWYGWKNDPNRSYYIVTALNGITYLSTGKYGQEVPTDPLPMFVFDNHNKVKNGFNIILGRINGSKITGTIYAWTDLTIEYDSQGNIITVRDHGQIHPKGLIEKAQAINIDLSPNS